MTTTPKRESYDVVVIGAGPAGLGAAATAAEAGLSTLLLDENMGPGGQVFRAIASTPVTERDRLGADYWAGAELVQAARESGAEIIQRATVWSLDRNLEIGVSVGGVSAFVKAQRVILATGALERPFPIPGWTLPGVMTAGAAQTMLKSSALVPEGRTVIAGQGPLLWLLAAQILRLGGRMSLLGIPSKPVELNLAEEVIFKGATVQGINGRRMYQTWYQMTALLKAGKLDLHPVITNRIAMKDFASGMELLKTGEASKILVYPNGTR